MTFVLLPNAGQSLGQTRADIRGNFNIIQDAFGRNHVSLNDGTPGNRGKHNFSEYVAQGSTPTITAGECATYGRNFGGVTQLTFTHDATGNVYQLTRAIPASVARFSTNTNYTGTQSGGWTFLPGGMLFQYGSRTNPGTSGTITFPTAFTGAPYSLNLTLLRTSASNDGIIVDFNTIPTASGFDYKINISGADGFYWMAIGV